MQSLKTRLYGGGLRPRIANAALALVLVLSILGCHSQVDEMRMRIDEAEQGSLTAQVSANVEDADSEEELANSATYQELNDIRGELTTRCNVRNVLYMRETTAYLDLRSAFTDVDDLNSMLRCAAINVREPSVEFERHDGFLRNRFIVRFTISQERRRCAEGPAECAPPPSFPRVLLLTVPGKVHAINNLSRLVGINLASRQIDDDTVRVEVRPAADYRAQNRRHFADRPNAEEMDELKVEIVSRVANYNLGTFLSVIGIIVGSGLFFKAAPWLYSRFKKNKASA